MFAKMSSRYKIRWKQGKKLLWIPDLQVRSGVPTDHLDWLAAYIAELEPDYVVQAGDWADMPSLSSYDSAARKAVERKFYTRDIDATNASIDRFVGALAEHGVGPDPNSWHVLLGNHEDRINRVVANDPALEGIYKVEDLNFEAAGFKVHPFLKPLEICGIRMQHYFPQNSQGRIRQTKRGSSSANSQMNAIQMSCISGHAQGLDVSHRPGLEGGSKWSIIAGSFYLHNERYLTACGNNDWRGIVVCHDIHKGCFDPMFVSIDWLARKYGR